MVKRVYELCTRLDIYIISLSTNICQRKLYQTEKGFLSKLEKEQNIDELLNLYGNWYYDF